MLYEYIEVSYTLTVGSASDEFEHIVYDLECEPKDLSDVCSEDVKRVIKETALSKESSINDWLLSKNLINEFKKEYSIKINEINTEE